MKSNNSLTVSKAALIVGVLSLGLLTTSRVAQATFVVGPGFAEPGYTPVYELPIPTTGATFDTTGVPYTKNISASIVPGSFSRIGYYLELGTVSGSVNQWISISMNAFTPFATKIGVPNTASGEDYNFANTLIANMNVFSNVGGVVTGLGIGTGNIEFWPSDYGGGNGYGVPGAGGNFDFGDSGDSVSNGHGSMQLHNYGAGQTLFGFNDWGGNNPGEPIELGIGTNAGGAPFGGAPDWTFAENGASWVVKNLQILVNNQQVPEPSTFLLLAFGGMGIFGWVKRSRRQQPTV